MFSWHLASSTLHSLVHCMLCMIFEPLGQGYCKLMFLLPHCSDWSKGVPPWPVFNTVNAFVRLLER